MSGMPLFDVGDAGVRVTRPARSRNAVASPAVAAGIAYVGSDDGRLYTFDAGGKRKCSGAPKTCQPLWVGVTGGA